MVAEKRGNHIQPANLEVRYLIAALKIPIKKADQYGMERERLELELCHYFMEQVCKFKGVDLS